MSSNQPGCRQVLIGVVFRCTIRSGHASLAIIVTSDDVVDSCGNNSRSVVSSQFSINADSRQDQKVVLVVIRFCGSQWNTDSERSSSCGDMMTLLRSNIRRMCKLGNELEFHGSFERQLYEQQPKTPSSSDRCSDITIEEVSCVNTGLKNVTYSLKNFSEWDRFIVDYSPQALDNKPNFSNIRVIEGQKWDSARCQMLRAKYFPPPTQIDQTKSIRESSENKPKCIKENSTSKHHKSGLGKRQQGELVADFLLWVVSTIYNGIGVDVPYNGSSENCDFCSLGSLRQNTDCILEKYAGHSFMDRWVPLDSSLATTTATFIHERNARVANLLCQRIIGTNRRAHSGSILDVAGGAGHVTLALALRDVKSTVVDPRCTVGSLPGRDRKLLKKAKKEPFGTYRAWFGSRPAGIDVFFREGCQDYFAGSVVHSQRKASLCRGNESFIGPDEKFSIPICSMDSKDQLLRNSTAIVALHPDEATGIIVETAVEHRIPFVVIPCCVFSRLFPDRLTKEGHVVSTYYDLIDWLVAKDPAIHVTRLPFDGANLAVWATFL
ncbi:hypothetical protein HJC23_010985 [Cyclotella cryptica]|uniref:Methyltransferase domain-containing protein n=1 Tax=Cyclotella cryptica TaxID=29204 RepID=A0ABD3PY87_9STRA|eukprot:CCRYP_010282-RA/>CCRYP_010282-RA protein AED:0.01 eAED:0.01 QI:200/1/1/1/1/1/2/2296/549